MLCVCVEGSLPALIGVGGRSHFGSLSELMMSFGWGGGDSIMRMEQGLNLPSSPLLLGAASAGAGRYGRQATATLGPGVQ